MDINRLVVPFILNHVNESDDSFSSAIPNFLTVTGILIEDATLQNPKNERELQKIGTCTWTPLTKPLDFFKSLRNKVKEVQNQGVIATLRHNPDLMEVMKDILWRKDLKHINWHNLRNLGQMFSQCALGYLKSESDTCFKLNRESFGVEMRMSEDAGRLREKAKTFMRQAFSESVLDRLRSLFVDQASGASVEVPAVAVRQSAPVTEVGGNFGVENDLDVGSLQGHHVMERQAQRLEPIVEDQQERRGAAAADAGDLERGLLAPVQTQNVIRFGAGGSLVLGDDTKSVVPAIPATSAFTPSIVPSETASSVLSESGRKQKKRNPKKQQDCQIL